MQLLIQVNYIKDEFSTIVMVIISNSQLKKVKNNNKHVNAIFHANPSLFGDQTFSY